MEENKTLEELAVQIQAGERQLVPELWERTKRLLFKLAYSYYSKHRQQCEAAGVTLEDLQQESFIALMGAVKAFEPAKGFRFTSYINYQLLSHFGEITGMERRNPLNSAISLDAPLTDAEEGLTVGGTIEDKRAGEEYENAETRAYVQALHEALEKSLAMLDERQRRIVRGRHYENKTLASLSRELETPYSMAQALEAKALKNLRKPESESLLLPFVTEYIETRAYRGTGFASFRDTCSTVQERIVERLEDFPRS